MLKLLLYKHAAHQGACQPNTYTHHHHHHGSSHPFYQLHVYVFLLLCLTSAYISSIFVVFFIFALFFSFRSRPISCFTYGGTLEHFFVFE